MTNLRKLERKPDENAIEAADRLLTRCKAGQVCGFSAICRTTEDTVISVMAGDRGDRYEVIGAMVVAAVRESLKLLETETDADEPQEPVPEGDA